MSETKSVAELLGEFLEALSGANPVRWGLAGEALRRRLPQVAVGEKRPPLVGLSGMAAMLRHYETTAAAEDRFAFGAARMAIEVRLEQILESLTAGEASNVGAVS